MIGSGRISQKPLDELFGNNSAGDGGVGDNGNGGGNGIGEGNVDGGDVDRAVIYWMKLMMDEENF